MNSIYMILKGTGVLRSSMTAAVFETGFDRAPDQREDDTATIGSA
jgi:hypothetical protein